MDKYFSNLNLYKTIQMLSKFLFSVTKDTTFTTFSCNFENIGKDRIKIFIYPGAFDKRPTYINSKSSKQDLVYVLSELCKKVKDELDS